jgi:hypothetical protein
MKTKTKAKINLGALGVLAVLTFIFQLSTLNCFSDLTATVTPGYQFPLDGSVPPTYQDLNLLGQPTVSVNGTTSGTNIISAGSLSGVQMVDTFPDSVYTTWNANSPRQISVLPGGLAGAGLIATGINWDGLSALQLYVDTNYFRLATNSVHDTNSVTSPSSPVDTSTKPAYWLTLQPNSITDTNISPTALIQGTKMAFTGGGFIISSGARTNGLLYLTNAPGVITMLGPGLMITNMTTTIPLTNNAGANTTTNWTGPTVVMQQFVSGLYSVPSGGGVVTNVAHFLGATPTLMRWVFVKNGTADSTGYLQNDEVPVVDVVANTPESHPTFTEGANSTNVFLSWYFQGQPLYITCKTNNSQQTFTAANWQAKCYARP